VVSSRNGGVGFCRRADNLQQNRSLREAICWPLMVAKYW
jgi:hypothetical protein